LDDLREIFTERSRMAKVPNGVETLRKISIARVRRTNVTDDRRQTDGRTDDDIIANVNMSSPSLKMQGCMHAWNMTTVGNKNLAVAKRPCDLLSPKLEDDILRTL